VTRYVSRTELTHGLQTSIKGVTHLPTINSWEADAGEEAQYDLDNFCGSVGFVAIGTCHFLHFRRIHPHPIVGGHRHYLDSIDSGAKRDCLIAEINQIKPIFWSVTRDVPAFARFEGVMFLNGPVWQLELTTMEWPE
jgi:hypothetical protein